MLKKIACASTISRYLCYLCLALSLLFYGHNAYLLGKAKVAQLLLAQAWQQNSTQAKQQTPWPWADFHPVAKLRFVEFDTSYIVLNTDSGQALAFAPGITGAKSISESGVKIISAHNDSHFNILAKLSLGDAIQLETAQGRIQHYRVAKIKVQDLRENRWLSTDTEDNQSLVMVTCYPFAGATRSTPYRYIVYAALS